MESLIYTVIISFVLTLAVGVFAIPVLRRLKFGQYVRQEGPQAHFKKAGTPTMGGVIFLIPICIAALALARGSLDFLLAALLVMLGFGFIGFLDDYLKILRRRSLGLKAYQKMLAQIAIGVIFSYYAYTHVGSAVTIPFVKAEWDLDIMYIPLMTFIIVGTVNSVNLNDGLDGLASGVTLIVAATFSILAAYLASSMRREGLEYMAVNYDNLMVFAGAVTGGCLGFLRFNAYPAQVFMGDTGAMGLGGAVVALAVLLKLPLFLPIIGGVYMAETLSVIIQVASYKLTGKRVFRMSPLHHHFELSGMSEPRVVAMFMIATTLLCLIGLLAV
ncbi:phospho-N-acetylmuramoyl-pentapeptide-transferase [Caldicoprobacter guelmensis]|uniref:phospho-N-acetylmuramoyl-pentapeptide- transferase n=1 Tax=Caldicoprobacter guelmensis TaxID=1170224 RepID=UPI001955FB31|nr:phospho-N-acetylmuramoyl-pentapeptide-transferase [Caldicoprobacter guelmensis]MBM7583307.1 phospho-N-acetylmuramoyl-pentapeptide-transferase [Caldicoprobacter guelmensis]